jgi:hypothetical protein
LRVCGFAADNSADNKRACGGQFGGQETGPESLAAQGLRGNVRRAGRGNDGHMPETRRWEFGGKGVEKVLNKILCEAIGLSEVFYGSAKTGENEASWRINGIEALEMWLVINLNAWEEVRVNNAFDKPVLLARNGGVFFLADKRLRSILSRQDGAGAAK